MPLNLLNFLWSSDHVCFVLSSSNNALLDKENYKQNNIIEAMDFQESSIKSATLVPLHLIFIVLFCFAPHILKDILFLAAWFRNLRSRQAFVKLFFKSCAFFSFFYQS